MPTKTATRAPFAVGEPVRFLIYINGTCLANGTVTTVAPVGDWFRVHTITTGPSPKEASFLVRADGGSDYLSAGHFDSCNDCGHPANVQDGSGTWRGPRSEVVCRDPKVCAQNAAFATYAA